MNEIDDPLTAPAARDDQVDATPPVDAVETFPLHPAALKLWAWQGAITAGVIAVGGFFPSMGFGIADGSWRVFGMIWLLFALAAVIAWRVMANYHRRYAQTFRCALLPDGLLVERGVWWRRQTFVPRARVQHTDVDEGPIARHFGMATLKVFTAGTSESEIEVEGLSREHAIALRDRLLGRGDRDGV